MHGDNIAMNASAVSCSITVGSNMQLDFACLPGEGLRSGSLIRCESFVKNVICLDNLKRALDMRDKQCVFIPGFGTTIVLTARWSPQINCQSMIN